jgi:hypothetical protein
MRRLVLLACTLTMCLAGCATRELCGDQDKIRCCLLDLYTNQIMDNLVRASNGMPIIQIDYTNATSQVTISQTGTVSDQVQRTRMSVLTLAAASSYAITRSTVNTLMGMFSASNSNQVAVTGTPVTTSNEVYDAYLHFLTLPGSLQSGPCPPPEGAAQICRKCGDQYYWVPIEYRKEFFGLALVTTAQRGKPITAPDAYEVTLQQVIGDPVPVAPDEYQVTVAIDKKIPNDSGRVVLSDGKGLFIGPFEPKTGPSPAETDRLNLYLDLRKQPLGAKTVDEFKAKLPAPAKVHVRGHQPEAPTTNDLLNRVNFQLQQIQFNQVRTGGL